MQKLLVILICLTFSIPSQCCGIQKVSCSGPEVTVSSCCSGDICQKEQLPTDSNRPCCGEQSTTKVFMGTESAFESVGISELAFGFTKLPLQNTPLFSLDFSGRYFLALDGRCIRMRMQSWLC
tara:strand:- start:403 stop:771 length:369 start_codon:yes stop_codon:yes gene_type:complete